MEVDGHNADHNCDILILLRFLIEAHHDAVLVDDIYFLCFFSLPFYNFIIFILCSLVLGIETDVGSITFGFCCLRDRSASHLLTDLLPTYD